MYATYVVINISEGGTMNNIHNKRYSRKIEANVHVAWYLPTCYNLTLFAEKKMYAPSKRDDDNSDEPKIARFFTTVHA